MYMDSLGIILSFLLMIGICVLGCFLLYKLIKAFAQDNSMEVIKWLLLGVLLASMTTCTYTCEINKSVRQMRVY